MVNVTVSIPEEVMFDTRLNKQSSETNAKKATALFFYTKLGVSLGYCAQIAGMTKTDFIQFLSDNKVSVFSFDDENELKEDIANA